MRISFVLAYNSTPGFRGETIFHLHSEVLLVLYCFHITLGGKTLYFQKAWVESVKQINFFLAIDILYRDTFSS